jgi:hypothetical protein
MHVMVLKLQGGMEYVESGRAAQEALDCLASASYVMTEEGNLVQTACSNENNLGSVSCVPTSRYGDMSKKE